MWASPAATMATRRWSSALGCRVTAKVGYKFHNIYRGKGPVLTAVSVEPAEKPLEEVVTFS